MLTLRSLLMKWLFSLILITNSLALPPEEEVLRLLLSEDAKDRQGITAEIWEAGQLALPLVEKLSRNDDPEVASRTGSIYRRLRMGLGPDSPDDLLKLATDLESAPTELREQSLQELLEHPDGVPVAVAFLDLRSQGKQEENALFSILAGRVTGALLEQRDYWRTFFTRPLSHRTRAAVIADLADRDMPMNHRMITALATDSPAEVYAFANDFHPKLTSKTRMALARAALVKDDARLAIKILIEGLPFASEDILARKIAFLELATNVPPRDWNGKWKDELAIFRARASGDLLLARKLSEKLPASHLLRLETKIICDPDDLQQESAGIGHLEAMFLTACGQFFGTPPLGPDIEALSSTVTGESGFLARTLLTLGHPREAAEILDSDGQKAGSLKLLWHAGLRKEAEELVNESLQHPDGMVRSRMRIEFAELLISAGLHEKAIELLKPLGGETIKRSRERNRAIRLAARLGQRELALKIAPDLTKAPKHARSRPISNLLPYPPGVSIFWYERFRKANPETSPKKLLDEVTDLVERRKDEALVVIKAEYVTSKGQPLLHSHHLYQNAVFFRAPCAIELAGRFAWQNLEVNDLLKIASSDTWPEETRKKAWDLARQIHPAEPALADVESVNFAALTFGEPGSHFQLMRSEKHRELMKKSYLLRDLSEGEDLRSIRTLARSMVTAGDYENVPEMIRIAIMGEIAHGPHLRPSYGELAMTMQAYCQSMEALAEQSEKLQWRQLGVSYGLPINDPANSSPDPSRSDDAPASK